MMVRKFDAVDTAPLFDMDATDKPKRERVKSVRQAKCPHCSAVKTGLVRQGDHLVWRLHTLTTWAGTSRTCPASGVAVCVAPERVPLIPSRPARCKHDE